MGLQSFKRGGQALLGVLFCVFVADLSLKFSEGPALALHDVQDGSSIYMPHHSDSAMCGLNPSPTLINTCPREADMGTTSLKLSDKNGELAQHEGAPVPTLHTNKLDDARLLAMTLAASPLDMAMLPKRRRLCSYADERCRRFTQGYSAFFLWVSPRQRPFYIHPVKIYLSGLFFWPFSYFSDSVLDIGCARVESQQFLWIKDGQ